VKSYFLYGGIALCLFALWVTARRDWVRLIAPSRHVTGVVVRHVSHRDAHGLTYAAVYRFTVEGAEHEVTDQVYGSSRKPEPGARVALSYPAGRPDLARPPRLLLWLGVYALLIGLTGMLVAKLMGKLG